MESKGSLSALDITYGTSWQKQPVHLPIDSSHMVPERAEFKLKCRPFKSTIDHPISSRKRGPPQCFFCPSADFAADGWES
jgi:hypothetical protein